MYLTVKPPTSQINEINYSISNQLVIPIAPI
jgi:hypothetical protein